MNSQDLKRVLEESVTINKMAFKNTFLKVEIMLVLLLAMCGTTFAEMLIPMHAGKQWVFEAWSNGDETNKWTITLQIGEKITFNSLGYYHVYTYNYDNDDETDDNGYVRSTEDALYTYNPGGEDLLEFQLNRVGTSWSFYEENDSGFNYEFTEIVAIERVTVPFGTFNKAYKLHKYSYDDFGNRSPERDEWFVPGVGPVKTVDYWVENGPAPMTMELVNISSPIKDMMAETLNFFHQSVTNGDLAGIGKGKGKKELNSFQKLLETASELIEEGYNKEASEQLLEALLRCDGSSEIPDYVAGDATEHLAEMIQMVIDGL
jgi:hypothetical protein